mmetsp:Transcript_14626/g.34177  ORF Transcript_14626/g.34177 Transcript_14626/m.34177 type:complete len:973 (+) Transcript_14626:10-2928(+)
MDGAKALESAVSSLFYPGVALVSADDNQELFARSEAAQGQISEQLGATDDAFHHYNRAGEALLQLAPTSSAASDASLNLLRDVVERLETLEPSRVILQKELGSTGGKQEVFAPPLETLSPVPAPETPSLTTLPPLPHWLRRMELRSQQTGLVFVSLLFLVLVHILAVIDGFALEYGRYDDFRRFTMPVGRAFGQLLKLDCALVLLPINRGLLSALRRSLLSRVLPISRARELHMLLGKVIAVSVGVHGGGQLLNYSLRYNEPSQWTTGVFGLQQVFGTGIILTVVLTIMVATSIARVRRASFRSFMWAHQLYIPFQMLLIFHGVQHAVPTYYLFLLVPGFLLFLDRGWRVVQGRMYSEAAILDMCAHATADADTFNAQEQYMLTKLRRLLHGPAAPGAGKWATVRVDLAKPPGFSFRPGQYAELSFPHEKEWHPFTIASAPDDPFVRFIIQAQGPFTQKVYALATLWSSSKGQEVRTGSSLLLRGPFFAPSEGVYQYEHVVMAAGGVTGATPCLSVLRDMAANSTRAHTLARLELPQSPEPSPALSEAALAPATLTSSAASIEIDRVRVLWQERSESGTGVEAGGRSMTAVCGDLSLDADSIPAPASPAPVIDFVWSGRFVLSMASTLLFLLTVTLCAMALAAAAYLCARRWPGEQAAGQAGYAARTASAMLAAVGLVAVARLPLDVVAWVRLRREGRPQEGGTARAADVHAPRRAAWLPRYVGLAVLRDAFLLLAPALVATLLTLSPHALRMLLRTNSIPPPTKLEQPLPLHGTIILSQISMALAGVMTVGIFARILCTDVAGALALAPHRNDNCLRVVSVHLLLFLPSISDKPWLLNELQALERLDALSGHRIVSVHVFLSREDPPAQWPLRLPATRLSLRATPANPNPATAVLRPLYQRFSAWSSVRRAHSGEKASTAQVGVFYCGGSAIGSQLEEACHELAVEGSKTDWPWSGRQPGVRLLFHRENFD